MLLPTPQNIEHSTYINCFFLVFQDLGPSAQKIPRGAKKAQDTLKESQCMHAKPRRPGALPNSGIVESWNLRFQTSPDTAPNGPSPELSEKVPKPTTWTNKLTTVRGVFKCWNSGLLESSLLDVPRPCIPTHANSLTLCMSANMPTVEHSACMPTVEHSACMPAVEHCVCMPTHDGQGRCQISELRSSWKS